MEASGLSVKMFGEFSIKNDHYEYTPSSSKSMQVTTLIAYLISSRGTEVSKDKLMEILWPEDEISNPTGALRNLIYRARQELSRFFPNSKENCILFTRNAYSWNSRLTCTIDTDQFEQLYSQAQKENDPSLRFQYLEEMFKLYRGSFLPSFHSEEWVNFRSIYYQGLYTTCVLEMCGYLKQNGRYPDLLSLCEQAIQYDIINEDVYKEILNAYLEMGKPHKALDYYQSIITLFSSRYGTDASDSLKDVYQNILRAARGRQMNMDDLEENLKEESGAKGSFYCNFDIFKNIYQINIRSLRRIRSRRYLVLLTLEDSASPGVMTQDLQSEMENLRYVISHYLRKNDVFTQSSFSQYSLILTVPNEDGCHVAIDRTRARYENERTCPHVILHVDMRELT